MTRKQAIVDAIATLAAFLLVPLCLALVLPN